MENKHKFLVKEIKKGVGYQDVLIRYVKQTGDPLHDDLPTDLFQPGDTIYIDIPPPKPESEEDFNR